MTLIKLWEISSFSCFNEGYRSFFRVLELKKYRGADFPLHHGSIILAPSQECYEDLSYEDQMGRKRWSVFRMGTGDNQNTSCRYNREKGEALARET